MDHDPPNGPSHSPWVLHAVTAALGVLAVGIALTLALWALLDRIDHQAAERQVDLAARQASLRLEDYIAGRLLALRLMVDQMSEDPEAADEEAYRYAARRVQEHFTGFQAINWIDADGEVRWLEPMIGNEAAAGQLIYTHPSAGGFAEKARKTRQEVGTGPVDLYQGGRGVVSYLPTLSPDGALLGLVNGVFRIRHLVEDCFNDTLLHDYGLRLHDGEALVFQTDDFPAGAAVIGLGEVRVLDRVWHLELAPHSPVWQTLRHTNRIVLSLGFGTSLALSGLTFVLWRQREQRRAAALERSRLQIELQRARRLETIGRLAGGIAHDFNNLLTVVCAHAELARGHDPEADSHLDAVDAAGQRAAELTRQLLAFRGKHTHESRQLAFDAQLADLVGLLRRLVRADVEVKFAPDAAGCAVDLPPEQVAQILLNLVINASDALPEGGVVRIWTRVARAEPFCIELGVEDNGEGIAETAQPYLFDPFFTTKDAGTGMGLATVASIVEEAQGHIDLVSGVGGTTFRVLLPGRRVRAAGPVTEPRPEIRALPRGERLCVLLVDDDPEIRRAVGKGLERVGMQVITARHGADALHQVHAAGTPPDVVVSDQVMPVMGGAQLAAALRETYPGLPVILFSGYVEPRPGERRRHKEEGIYFLDKPVRIHELVQICMVLARRARARGAPADTLDGVS